MVGTEKFLLWSRSFRHRPQFFKGSDSLNLSAEILLSGFGVEAAVSVAVLNLPRHAELETELARALLAFGKIEKFLN